jgi:hypothetical protein
VEEYQRRRYNDIRREIEVSAVNHLGETVLPPRTFFLLYDPIDLKKGLHHITIEATNTEELPFLEQFAGKHNLENLSDRLYISLYEKGHKRPRIYSISRNYKNSQYPNEVTLSAYDFIQFQPAAA